MEVVTATPNTNGVPPYHNHDVHEWSTIDSLTGVLERARLETDHWTANTSSSSHNYGKVVDTRARSNADGAIQQQARRQLEVFQSSVPGGRLQVIKSHTVSSSRWTSKSPTASEHKEITHFTDLELPLNTLDLSSQKSKATVGRSVGRRPPSRPRGRDESSTNTRQTFTSNDVRSSATTNLHRISRLCNQVHENAVKQTFGKYYHKPPIQERERGDGVEINEIESLKNGHTNLVRTKSTSSEDIHLVTPEKDKQNKSIEDLEDLEQLQNWRRTSKIRRSLQFPSAQNKIAKPLDLPVNTGSVRKIREDLETGRRLNTALRGNNVDLDALDQILQSITTPNDKYEQPEKDVSVKKPKRHSFVTVESLQEVKGRLRRTSSPTDDFYNIKKDEEADDGIDTEEIVKTDEMPAIDNLSTQSSRVRSYVYGMEALMKKPILGTGSLESRTSRQVNGTCGNRSEDWYNRRKSYGFEQVHNHHDSINTITKNKLMDSSTDSGICRSSEIVLVPATNKSNGEIGDDKYVITRNGKYNNHNDASVGNVKRYASIFENKKENDVQFIKNKSPLKDYEGTKITIPIVSQEHYQTKQFDKNDSEIKRHSIAVDESKYVTRNFNTNNFRRTSLAINDPYLNDCLDDDLSQGKRHKKVEFCKTEVHFAVDSGRVNIVATDEKPPPTNNFRRRRRNSGTLYNNLLNEANKNGLPVLHFGDTSYEKSMFNGADYEEDDLSDPFNKQNDAFSENTVTVSTNQSNQNYSNVEEEKENVECETPKGILKNKPIKPKPYLLGDDPFCINATNTDEKEIWGIRLKPVQSSTDPPMWKSTVTLKNTLYDKHKDEAPSWENSDPNFNGDLYRPASPVKDESNVHNSIRIISSSTKRSPWTVADRIKQVEEIQKPEMKGYSTKVNIGGGSATVIEDDFKDDKRQLLNKGLVVRIGRDNDNSHTICSKTTTDKDNTTTTTKITIDLSPSPDINEEPSFQFVRLPRASLSNFKSTSLVLNTFKTEKDLQGKSIPQQLEALRRLYEDWHSDNEADKEVQLLMNKPEHEPSKEFDANSSVVSGSWSKMRAFRNMQQQRAKTNAESCFNSHARLEKGSLNASQLNTELKELVTPSPKQSPKLHRKIKLSNRTPTSPVVLRKTYCDSKKQDLRTAYNSEKLSSPSLVGQNVIKTEIDKKFSWKKSWETPVQRNRSPSPIKRLPLTYAPSRLETNTSQSRIDNIDSDDHKTSNRSVLRTPKRSEMAYFGVKMSPKLERKTPETRERLYKTNKGKKEAIPIYENVDTLKNKNKIVKREFDSSILDELTKAADQILQAVNGYAEETEKQEEEKKALRKEKLDTISETKSWKQRGVAKHNCNESQNVAKTKLKHTSSTSSVESVSEFKKLSARRSLESDRQKKKSGSDTSSSRAAATKARRLQRASSREALLQSHGSSSEDLPVSIDVPLRKPRLVRKTKTVQETNVDEKNKKSREKGKSEERIPVGALPTIRHKTAVSTIRSTAEKAQIRERNNRLRNEDAKRKTPSKITTGKSEKNRNISSKDPINHRISTANIKKCNKADVLIRS
ncbi:hypothetical protein RN001_012675 [Aquatica leii]|uniref:Uncharacterized protein n=1 Tax=Aquatica leii TaxID=1421715 RepID=A0AAN7SMJ9_9COLE|nr:hypothetical protein RN001_012675 [Aquatica leii]